MVAAPAADFVLAPVIADFLSQYPEISLEVSVDRAFVDIVEARFDAGIRPGERIARDMIAVRISDDMPFVLAASPRYVEGRGAPGLDQRRAQHRRLDRRRARRQRARTPGAVPSEPARRTCAALERQYQNAPQQAVNYFVAHGSSLAQAQSQAVAWIGQQVETQSALLAYVDRAVTFTC
jgi:DNA-binding transcriptional LysR family regulator